MNSPLNIPSTQPAKVSLRDQIVNLLEPYPAMLSSGAQTFTQFPTRQGNGYSMPLDSQYVRSFVSASQTDANQPIPTERQFREAIDIISDKVLAGPASSVRFPLHTRYAWDPGHARPIIGAD